MTTLNLNVTDIKPFIGARDFDQSLAFYVTLGWRLIYDSNDLRVLELADHRFYLQRYYDKTWCDNTMLHLFVESIDDWFEFVETAFRTHDFLGDARHDDAIGDEGYARTFHVWDPSGVLIHFAEPPPATESNGVRAT